ncbi:helix-turn-helix domain-containing protein [Pleionea sp. CnH1-48]|uniref:winged helix-turn-helix domain-containing protein n=1 Tax=Pleionea sp. CnH1-48 TaxID=2954494 RepID=UPI0035314CEB
MHYSKTKTSFYRRLYVAYLIDSGVNSVPAIMAKTGMPRRTAQDTIKALAELDIKCHFNLPKKSGYYEILDWGAMNKEWIHEHLERICSILGYQYEPFEKAPEAEAPEATPEEAPSE